MLSNKQKEIILEIFGEKRYNEAIRCIDVYTEKWQLDNFELIDVPARNLVLISEDLAYKILAAPNMKLSRHI